MYDRKIQAHLIVACATHGKNMFNFLITRPGEHTALDQYILQGKHFLKGSKQPSDGVEDVLC